ncbi:helix-turn-helix domain-containing protein [Solibacillus silvestris]|uniref:helix-turn-helix domain-containing protein n=1 Tax=Solibacillus silvestris TaxID=76853 RepID=UPI003F7E4585
MTDFGAYIKKIRDSKGMTLNQVAMYAEISAAQLSRIETGKRGTPKPQTIEKIAQALKVDYNDLMQIAGYLNEEDITHEVIIADKKITLSEDDFKILQELKKHPIAFEDLKSDPEKKIKQMIGSWDKIKKLLSEIDEDDKDYLE